MLKIRLARVGKKKQPAYRVVVADARSPRDGRYVEIVGHYNPLSTPKVFQVDEDKVRDWLSKGAQPSEPVQRLLKSHGVSRERATATTAAAVSDSEAAV